MGRGWQAIGVLPEYFVCDSTHIAVTVYPVNCDEPHGGS